MRPTRKRDIAEKMHERYLKAKTRAQQAQLLHELVELTRYHRGHSHKYGGELGPHNKTRQ